MSMKRQWRTFVGNEQGQMAVILALTLIVILVIISAAVDLSKMVRAKSKLQDDVDAAVVAAAREVYINRASEQDAAALADRMIEATNTDDTLNCEAPVFTKIDVSMACRVKVNSSILKLVPSGKMGVAVSSTASIGQRQQLEVALVIDISDSMEKQGNMPALERALKEFVEHEAFDNTNVPAAEANVFSIIPFANSVAFDASYTKWRSPQSQTQSFSGCFTKSMYDAGMTFSGEALYIGAPQRIGNKGSPYCPQMTVKFFQDSVRGVSNSIKNIKAGHGTGTQDGLLWGYRALHPNQRGVLTNSRIFPRDFKPDQTKVLILMTDGKATYKPWVKGMPKLTDKQSEELFAKTCATLKGRGEKIDIYMIGFGDLSRKDSDFEQQMKNCVSGRGAFYEADGSNLGTVFTGILNQAHDIAITH